MLSERHYRAALCVLMEGAQQSAMNPAVLHNRTRWQSKVPADIREIQGSYPAVQCSAWWPDPRAQNKRLCLCAFMFIAPRPGT